MPMPVLLAVGPLVLAALLLPLSRRRPDIAGVVAALLTLILRSQVAGLPLADGAPPGGLFRGDSWSLLGSSLLMTVEVQQLFLFLYGLVALVFLLSALWPQGPDFAPAGLALLSPLAIALMWRPFVFGVAVLLVIAALAAVLAQSGRIGNTRAALRYLLMTVLAVPLFLLAGWMLESQGGALLSTIWRLLLVGFLILLASFPFHIWVRPLISEAAPLAAAYLFGPVQLAVLLLGFVLLLNYPAVEQDTQFLPLLRLGGAATVAVAALLVITANDWDLLLGYTLLADMGMALLAYSFGVSGLHVALALILLRTLALVAAGLGWQALRPAGQHFSAARGLARQHPLAAALAVVGVLSLAGLPLTPGFYGRWQAIALAAYASPWYVVILVLAVVATAVPALRLLALLLAEPAEAQAAPTPVTRLIQLRQVALALLLLIIVLFTLFPRPLLNLATELATLAY